MNLQKSIWLFPGQGSQFVGMGKELFDQFPSFIRVADKVFGRSLVELCCDSTEQELASTENAQPALFCVNSLRYLSELKNGEQTPNFFIGHSLGEYVALFAAGVMSFRTALEVVCKRGQLMRKVRKGAMLAVSGIQEKDLSSLLMEFDDKFTCIACFNSPNQFVVSISEDNVKNLSSLISAKKGHSSRLNTSGQDLIPSSLSDSHNKDYGIFLRKMRAVNCAEKKPVTEAFRN